MYQEKRFLPRYTLTRKFHGIELVQLNPYLGKLLVCPDDFIHEWDVRKKKLKEKRKPHEDLSWILES